MRWTMYLPVEIPSANALKRALYGGNRGAYSSVRREFAYAVAFKCRQIPKATGPRSVTITRLIAKRGRQYDQDNLVAGAKGLMDELVAHGLLLGDAPHQVTVTYQQERGGGPAGATRVVIEEAS